MASGPMSHEEYSHHKKDIYKTTLLLSLITIGEVGIALFYDFVLIEEHGFSRFPLNIFLIVASLAKGFFIMATFMHVKHENKAFIWTIFTPFLFLVWAIIAFTMEGASWMDMRSWLNMF